MSSKRFAVRPATAGDVTQMSDILARSGLGSAFPQILEFYLATPGTRLLVGCRHDRLDRVVGVAGCVSFGRTGWLGSVAVDPDARGQGLGTAVSEAAMGCLRRAGVATVLLTATELGRPVYEKLGFADDGVSYGIWELAGSPILTCEDPSAVRPGRIADVIAMDAAATGEDRRRYLTPFGRGSRAFAGRERTGYRLALPWGGGPVVASCAGSGRALLADMIRTSPSRLAFPQSNAQAAGLAAASGFRLARQVRRMRLGPPVPGYRPEVIYNVFSLAVG